MIDKERLRSIQALFDLAEVEDLHYAIREGYISDEIKAGLTESERGLLEHVYLALRDLENLMTALDLELGEEEWFEDD